MLKFKETSPENLDVVILLDNSASMRRIKNAAIESLNKQINSFKNEALRTGIKTDISVLTFDEAVSIGVRKMDSADFREISPESYSANGNSTALRDAINAGLDTLAGSFSKRKLLMIITDGIENSSRLVSEQFLADRIKGLPENITIVAHGPNSCQFFLQSIGIPVGNINLWTATEEGTRFMTQMTTISNTSLYDNYRSGATRSMNYFTPDLSNLPPTVVETNLKDLTPNFSAWQVENKVPISKFVTNVVNKPYRVGSAYYQLTKKETVQGFKDILIREKPHGRIFGGDGIRGMLRIPAGGTIELNPASSPNFEIFVKSTSHNRNLMPNTSVLVAK
jgi:hypothetical protein